MSEQQTGRTSPEPSFSRPAEYARYQDAPMPPPVTARRYPSQLRNDVRLDPRSWPANDPSNHHRHRAQPGRPIWPWLAILGLTIAAGLASLVGLAVEQPASDPIATIDSAEVAADDPAAADPFERYLELVEAWGITDAPELSRDDAQTRAILGCSSQWAPGTIDAALAEAYDGYLEQFRDQGLCD